MYVKNLMIELGNLFVSIKKQIFEEYPEDFRDAKRLRPLKGQVFARFKALAYLGDGPLKRMVLNFLRQENGAQAAISVFSKDAHSSTTESVKLIKEILLDITSGKSEDEIAEKPYEFITDRIFWVYRDKVPVNDPRWETITPLEYGPLSKSESV